MIFTLLYSSPLLNGNKRRNIYIYIIGALLYAIIHWLLYSPICDQIGPINKYRKLLYVIVALDVLYVGKKYNESIVQNQINLNMDYKKPILETVSEDVHACCNKNNNQCYLKNMPSKSISQLKHELKSDKQSCHSEYKKTELKNETHNDETQYKEDEKLDGEEKSNHEDKSTCSIPTYVPMNAVQKQNISQHEQQDIPVHQNIQEQHDTNKEQIQLVNETYKHQSPTTDDVIEQNNEQQKEVIV
jgi:hypothetical protein